MVNVFLILAGCLLVECSIRVKDYSATDTLFVLADNMISPCLWVGTVLGSVFVVAINLPPGESRLIQPVLTMVTGISLLLLLPFNSSPSEGGFLWVFQKSITNFVLW